MIELWQQQKPGTPFNGGQERQELNQSTHVGGEDASSWYALVRAICAARPQKAAAVRHVCWHTPGSHHWTDTGDLPERRGAPPVWTRSLKEPLTNWRCRLKTQRCPRMMRMYPQWIKDITVKWDKQFASFAGCRGVRICSVYVDNLLADRQCSSIQHQMSHTCCLANKDSLTRLPACRQSCQSLCQKPQYKNRISCLQESNASLLVFLSRQKADSFVLFRATGESPPEQSKLVNLH